MVTGGMRDAFIENPPAAKFQKSAGKPDSHAMGERRSTPRAPDPESVAKEMIANRESLAALVLRGPDAKKHAALRVASAYDSLFSDDPFGIYRTSPFQTSLWEMLLSHRRVRSTSLASLLLVTEALSCDTVYTVA